MSKISPALLVLVAVAIVPRGASAQLSVTFQEGVNGYAGTVDTEFRAADAFDPQGDKDFVSVDEFDGGFQTQGAIRFESIFGNQPGQVPSGVTIAFATLTVWVDSGSAPDAIIGFNRVLPASPWDETSTWFSLGGDTFTDPETGLIENDAILQDDVESLATPDGVVPDPEFSDGFLDIDVTTSVQAWYAGAPNLGWGINNSTGNGWDMFSSEYGDPMFPDEIARRPQLTIGYFLKAGDLDFDNDVDLFDYELLLANIGVHLDGPIAQGATGDLDFDRDVDLDDFAEFKNLYPGGPSALAAALRGVPEPSAAVLGLLAAIGALPLARRRRAATR